MNEWLSQSSPTDWILLICAAAWCVIALGKWIQNVERQNSEENDEENRFVTRRELTAAITACRRDSAETVAAVNARLDRAGKEQSDLGTKVQGLVLLVRDVEVLKQEQTIARTERSQLYGALARVRENVARLER